MKMMGLLLSGEFEFYSRVLVQFSSFGLSSSIRHHRSNLPDSDNVYRVMSVVLILMMTVMIILFAVMISSRMALRTIIMLIVLLFPSLLREEMGIRV